ncbi:MAG: hypothetical protein LBQ11_00725 [Candidatus Nomurabacteria bacterium]|jgi:ribulose-phosphate 3-epimerase|nr:hypothetical protein [Candidatus Nomurabacteria bacterium]
MSEIIPTITASTPNEYASQLARLDFAPRIHIDITDGEFTPSRTVNLNQVYWDEAKIIDLHLMMKQPDKWPHQIIALAPNLVILHAEAENLPQIFDHLHKFNIKCGVALLPETTPDQVIEIIKIADQVLIFGGHLGYQGGTADLKQLKKVAEIRAISPNVEIAWDGGANLDNVAEISAADIDIINVGSAIQKAENPEEIFGKLTKNLTF